MIRINFVEFGGFTRSVDAPDGETVMKAALEGGVSGILADCGGGLSCATCHVHVAPEWVERVGPPDADEQEMLGMALDVDDTSRLSCQIVLRPELDGIVIRVPRDQA